MSLVILCVSNPMIRETRLPDLNLFFFAQAVGISALDKLDGALQRNFGRWREQRMDVVRHDDELVQ